MTDFALWVRGLHSPTLCLLRNRDPDGELTALEQARKLGPPIPLPDAAEPPTLAALALAYPAPPSASTTSIGP